MHYAHFACGQTRDAHSENSNIVSMYTVYQVQNLKFSVSYKFNPLASLLLQIGAIINAQTIGKQTPLHLTACIMLYRPSSYS